MKDLARAQYKQTAQQFHEHRYLFVKGILPRVILDYLKAYYAVLASNDAFSGDEQCPSSLSLGADRGLDAVLEWVRPEVSRLVGFELAPTYSYTRRYAKGERLPRHVDRAACEISMTTSIAIPKGAGASVVYLKPPRGRETKVEMREGDGCIYAGTEVEHWREPFLVDGYVQLFLHFISKRGPNFPRHAYDGRKCLGASYAPRD